MRPNEQYLAGLWSGSLCKDLVWYINWDEYPPEYKTPTKSQLSFPSWSWARRVPQLGAGSSSPGVICEGTWDSDFNSTVKIITANCKYFNNNAFGVLEKSCLILRGHLLPCYIRWPRPLGAPGCSDNSRPGRLPDLFYSPTQSFLRKSSNILNSMRVHMDSAEPFWRPFSRGFLLLMGIREGMLGFADEPECLLLRSTINKHERNFSRLGKVIFSFEEDKDLREFLRWFENHALMESCTLV